MSKMKKTSGIILIFVLSTILLIGSIIGGVIYMQTPKTQNIFDEIYYSGHQ